MKNRTKTCLLVLSVLMLSGLTGCKSVVSDHLIGVPIEAEQAAAFEGDWRIGDGVAHVKHTDGANLVVAIAEWDDDEFKLQQWDVVVTSHVDARFVQLKPEDEQADDEDGEDDDETDDGEQPWLLVGLLASSDDDSLVIYSPNFKRFEQILKDGELQGEVDEDGNNMHIQGDKAALDAYIKPENLHEMFRFDEPGVMTRIGQAK